MRSLRAIQIVLIFTANIFFMILIIRKFSMTLMRSFTTNATSTDEQASTSGTLCTFDSTVIQQYTKSFFRIKKCLAVCAATIHSVPKLIGSSGGTISGFTPFLPGCSPTLPSILTCTSLL
jgi:hypothetical protein